MKSESVDRLVMVAFSALAVSTIVLVAYQAGFAAARDQASEAKQCWACGETQACPFGPGVIGVQHCEVNQRWSKCEPDPRYRLPREGAAQP